MKVYINVRDKENKITGRKLVEVKLLQKNPKSVVVQLPNGKIITRRIPRDVPNENRKS